MYLMTASICSDVSSSTNDGMIGEKPRPWPPSVIVAFQSTSSSGVVPAQSEKSGNVDGRSNMVLVGRRTFTVWPVASGAAGLVDRLARREATRRRHERLPGRSGSGEQRD